jgi:hypothetical protein
VTTQSDEHRPAVAKADECLLPIRGKFILNVGHSMDMANSLTALVRRGQAELSAHVARYPEATFTVGLGDPETATLRTRARPIRALLDVFSQRDTVTNELIHAQVIQYWHDFLDELLAELVRRHLAGSRPYVGLGAIDLKLDCREITPANLVDRLVERAAKEFAFMESMEKLRVAAKALSASVPDTLMRAVRKHVTVRNVLQHNDGILRHEDLRRLGLAGAGLPMTDSKGEPAVCHAGERVAVSFWELMLVCGDLCDAAMLLVPDTEAQA